MSVFIQWHNEKNSKNIKKHGIAFDEAATTFFDTDQLIMYDEEHSLAEDRFIILGRSQVGRVLFVAFTHRRSTDEKKVEYYRIISARIANQSERQFYSKSRKRF